MTNEKQELTVNYSAPLTHLIQQINLMRQLKKQLERQVQEMVKRTETATAAVDLSSVIYGYTIHKTDSTLALTERVKAGRCPEMHTPELDELDHELRKEYLETVKRIAKDGTRNIFDVFNEKDKE